MSINAPREDLRIRRTKTHLRRALAELMLQRSLREIRVAEICDQAMVHRTTFYKHYADKQALFEDLLDDRVGHLFSVVGMPPNRAVQEVERPVETITAFLSELRADETVFPILADARLSLAFTPRLTRELVRQLQDRAPHTASQAEAVRADLLAHVHAAALVSALVWWAQGNENVDPEELARALWATLGQSTNPISESAAPPL